MNDRTFGIRNSVQSAWCRTFPRGARSQRTVGATYTRGAGRLSARRSFQTRWEVMLVIGMIILVLSTSTPAYAEKANVRARELLNTSMTKAITYPFQFAIISDSHLGYAPGCDFGLALVLLDIENYDVEFVINCGDFSDDGDGSEHEDFKEYALNYMDDTGVPLFTLPGNHDFYQDGIYDPGDGLEAYEEHIDDVRYTAYWAGDPLDPDHKFWDYYFDYGVYRFILLDDVQKHGTYCWDWTDNDGDSCDQWDVVSFTASQRDEVEPWFTSNTQNNFAFTHIYPRKDYPGYEENLEPLVGQHARACFYGHNHGTGHKSAWCGMDYFLAGTTCPQQSPSDTNSFWYLVTIDDLPDYQCKIRVVRRTYYHPTAVWATTQMYPFPSLHLKRKDIVECKNYVGCELSAGDVAEPFVVHGDGNVELVGGSKVTILPGFKVHDGGKLKVYIEDCVNNLCGDK